MCGEGKILFRRELHFVNPRNLYELHAEVQDAITKNMNLLISVGGDGTVNTMLQDLANQKIGLLVIPGGTANDLARELGLTQGVRQALSSYLENNLTTMDLIKVNNRYMATNGGIGVPADVARVANFIRMRYPLTKKLKSQVYQNLLGINLLNPLMKFHHLKIEFNNQTLIVKTPILLINNQPTVAGTARVSNTTVNNDGLFNLLIFKHTSHLKVIQSAMMMAKGNYPANDPDLISVETKQVKISSMNNEPISFFGDGEIFPANSVYDITMDPQTLKVYSLA